MHPDLVSVERVAPIASTRTSTDAPPEFLLPQFRRHVTLAREAFMQRRGSGRPWAEDDLRAAVDALGPWEYHFEFDYGVTTSSAGTYNDGTIRFHRYRSRLIGEIVSELLGRKLHDSTVLDLACHCGLFSFDFASRGAKSVRGVEVRAQNLRQATFLREYYGITAASFTQADVLSLDQRFEADIVLCLGILYHVIDPIGLLERAHRLARKLVVVETICHKEPISAFHLIGGKNTDVAIEGTRAVELHPTYRGVIDAMRAVGFSDVVEVIGECDEPIELFSDATRRCFIGFK